MLIYTFALEPPWCGPAPGSVSRELAGQLLLHLLCSGDLRLGIAGVSPVTPPHSAPSVPVILGSWLPGQGAGGAAHHRSRAILWAGKWKQRRERRSVATGQLSPPVGLGLDVVECLSQDEPCVPAVVQAVASMEGSEWMLRKVVQPWLWAQQGKDWGSLSSPQDADVTGCEHSASPLPLLPASWTTLGAPDWPGALVCSSVPLLVPGIPGPVCPGVCVCVLGSECQTA